MEPPFFSTLALGVFGAFGAESLAGLVIFGAAFLAAFFSALPSPASVDSSALPASLSAEPFPVTRRRALSSSVSFFSTALSAAFFSARFCAKSKSTNSMIAFSAASPWRCPSLRILV